MSISELKVLKLQHMMMKHIIFLSGNRTTEVIRFKNSLFICFLTLLWLRISYRPKKRENANKNITNILVLVFVYFFIKIFLLSLLFRGK